MNTPYPHLFSPIALGRRRSRNRIMRTAMTCQLGEGGKVSERQKAFYRTLARGGVGVIVTESLRPHPGPRPGIAAYDKDAIPGMAALAKVVHDEGALLVGQMNERGRQHHLFNFPTMSAPSAIACPKSGGIPHEMSVADIEEMVADHIESFLHVLEADFDGIEVHGAQGHLIGQFMSGFSNLRTDAYGGSLENRLRFPKNILRELRKRADSGAVLGFRLVVEEFSPGGIDVDEAIAIGRNLVEEGLVDYLSLSQGNFNSIEKHLPDRHFPPMPFRDLHARVKKAIPEIPVVSSNHMKTPEHAESMLAAGEADMVGLARPLLVDPDWPNKAAQGRADDIRKCIACNQCWLSPGAISCTTNPRAGRELQLDALPPAKASLRVVVVGGGPGGLEAARNAALRGHKATLFEREAELGGKIRLARRAPYFADLGNSIDYLIGQVRKSPGVAIRTGVEATAQAILAEAPDVVILATGARVLAPQIPGDGSIPVIADADPLKGFPDGPGRAVIMDEDGHYWGAAAAESAAALGRKPIVVTRFFEAFREVPVVCRIATLRSLDEQGAEIRPTTYVDRIEKGQVILRHYYSGREERLDNCSVVVWTGLQQVEDQLEAQLRAAGISRIHLIGDAYQPRRLKDAIHEAHNVTNKL